MSVRLVHQFGKDVGNRANPRVGVEKLTPFLSDSKTSGHEIYSTVNKTSKLMREDCKFDPSLSYMASLVTLVRL